MVKEIIEKKGGLQVNHDRKKELKQMFKETPIEAGIYKIKNTVNGKSFIASTRNFKTLNGVTFMLESGGHSNKALQAEWTEFGRDAFRIDILEKLKKDNEDPYFNEKEELGKLEEKWLENIQPFGENGYHKK